MKGQVQLVSQRLAAAGFGEDSDVTGHLVHPRWNLLGGRQLVRPNRTGVVWNPGDDRCVAAEVLLVGDAPGSRWLLSGEIIGVPVQP